MKWFRHNSDSYINLKMQEVIEDFGIEGYGLFWICCELVAQQGQEYLIDNHKNWKKAIANITKIKLDKINAILIKLAKVNLIDTTALKENRLFIPKMEEYSDDYTKKRRRVSEQYTDTIRTMSDKIPLHNNTRQDNTEHNNTLGSRSAEHDTLKKK